MKQFTCEACGGHKIEEIMCGVVQSSVIEDVKIVDEDIVCDYGATCSDGGDVDTIRYQCVECGFPVSEEELKQLAEE